MSKTKVTVFYSLIFEETCHHFLSVPFMRRKSRVSVYTERERFTHRHEYWVRIFRKLLTIDEGALIKADLGWWKRKNIFKERGPK